jgi:aldose 1-epimerase
VTDEREAVPTFTSDHLEVGILPAAGARLHHIRAFGRDLLRTPDELAEIHRDPFLWGGYVMAPWCNRIEAAPTEVAGRTATPRVNHGDGTAIHGLVHAEPWDEVGDGVFRIEREADPDWPWRFAVELTVGVVDTDLSLSLAVTNLDDGPMPAGIGIHPWFRQPVEVAIPARAVHRSNLTSDPLPDLVVDHPDHDLRALGPVAEGIDATWTDLERPSVSLRFPPSGDGSGGGAADGERADAGVEVELGLGSTARFVVAANIPGVDVAMEPQTHAPNGMRRLVEGEPGALDLLDPGRSLALDLRYRFARCAPVGS